MVRKSCRPSLDVVKVFVENCRGDRITDKDIANMDANLDAITQRLCVFFFIFFYILTICLEKRAGGKFE